MNMKSGFLVAMVSLSLFACGNEKPDAAADPVGQVTVALTGAPADVRCVVITATPATGTPVVRQFPVVPAQPAVFTVTQLPTGVALTLTEQAFTQACPVPTGTAPTWIADPVTVTLKLAPVDVTFNLRRASIGGQINARSNFPAPVGMISEFATGVSGTAHFITPGPDDNLWFIAGTSVGRITTAGTVTLFPAAPQGFRSFSNAITAGPDGNLWFTTGAQIGVITPAGVANGFSLPASRSPSGITAGRDGALWFTDESANTIGRITTVGVLSSFSIPSPSSVPRRIVVGPDNNLWFTEIAVGRIGRMTTSGVTTEFTVPTPNSGLHAIAAGADGALWFTEFTANKIGRITTSGAITEFSLPTADSRPTEITAGSDGNMWFNELNSGRIGRITPAGAVAEFLIPSPQPFPFAIAAGADGNIWFTEESGLVGRLRL